MLWNCVFPNAIKEKHCSEKEGFSRAIPILIPQVSATSTQGSCTESRKKLGIETVEFARYNCICLLPLATLQEGNWGHCFKGTPVWNIGFYFWRTHFWVRLSNSVVQINFTFQGSVGMLTDSGTTVQFYWTQCLLGQWGAQGRIC